MRAREHDRDLLPLDVNYALLDSLENRPEKGLVTQLFFMCISALSGMFSFHYLVVY